MEKRKGRGRPRLFDVESTLDRAVEVFWDYGYEGADLDTLTEAMGINRPSLYAAYGDKRALFFKAVQRYYQNLAMIELPIVDRADRLDTSRLREKIVDLFFEHERPRGCLIACVLAGQANAHDDAKTVLRDLIEREEHRIEAWASNLLSHDPGRVKARSYASFLIATLHSTAIKASAGFSREHIKAEIDVTMNTLDDILRG